MGGEPWHAERRDDGPDVRSRVVDAGGEGAFFFRKPLGDGLVSRREVAGFGHAERRAPEAETERPGGETVADGGEAPADE